MYSTLAQAVIPKLDRISETNGIRVELTSYNGPPLLGTEF